MDGWLDVHAGLSYHFLTSCISILCQYFQNKMIVLNNNKIRNEGDF